MRSIWDAATREELLARLERLSPDAQPTWGRLTAPRMLAHVNDAIRMGLGDLPCWPKRTALRYALVKKLVIYLMPWPKGTPTAPELLERSPASWDEEVAAFRALLDRFGARSPSEPFPEHPAFGTLSAKDWGALGFRHIDHHWTQFGV